VNSTGFKIHEKELESGTQFHIYCVPETEMKNITLAIDDEILDKVRIVAAHKRTTVNAMVREYLSEVAGRDEKQAEARKQLLRLMETSKGRMAPDWKFDREETHER
jgi:Arc/MetJ family transcription regulator